MSATISKKRGPWKKIQAALGITWAVLALPIVLVTFVGMNSLAPKLVSSTGLTISPKYSGGPVVRTIDHGAHLTRIHRTVFEALIGQSRTGFVQVDFVLPQPSENAPSAPGDAEASAPKLPEKIDEEIDFDGNGAPDFRITAAPASGSATVVPLGSDVVGLDETLQLEKGLAVRVKLRNKP